MLVSEAKSDQNKSEDTEGQEKKKRKAKKERSDEKDKRVQGDEGRIVARDLYMRFLTRGLLRFMNRLARGKKKKKHQ
jgi:hypothetical protein